MPGLNKPGVPLGVYEGPPPADLIGVESVQVGDGYVARRVRDLTRGVKWAEDLIDAVIPFDG